MGRGEAKRKRERKKEEGIVNSKCLKGNGVQTKMCDKD